MCEPECSSHPWSFMYLVNTLCCLHKTIYCQSHIRVLYVTLWSPVVQSPSLSFTSSPSDVAPGFSLPSGTARRTNLVLKRHLPDLWRLNSWFSVLVDCPSQGLVGLCLIFRYSAAPQIHLEETKRHICLFHCTRGLTWYDGINTQWICFCVLVHKIIFLYKNDQ